MLHVCGITSSTVQIISTNVHALSFYLAIADVLPGNIPISLQFVRKIIHRYSVSKIASTCTVSCHVGCLHLQLQINGKTLENILTQNTSGSISGSNNIIIITSDLLIALSWSELLRAQLNEVGPKELCCRLGARPLNTTPKVETFLSVYRYFLIHNISTRFLAFNF